MKEVLVFTHAAGNSEIGPNARWSRFSEGLAQFDVGVTIVGSSFFHKYRRTIAASLFKPVVSFADGAAFIHLWSPPYGGAVGRMVNQCIFAISIFFISRGTFDRKNFDVVIASSPHPFVVLGAYFWAKRCKAKFVYESRDLWPLLLIQHSGMSRFHPYVWLSGLMERFAVSKCDFILSPKEFESQYYIEKYEQENVFWVPNTSKSTPEVVVKSKSERAMSIIYSGSLQSIYNVREVIEAVRGLPDADISLIILGDGPELDALKDMSAGDGRVIFLGWLTGEEYNRALSEADVCYFSTADMAINEYGFSSNKISDYLARGKPILAHVSFGAEGLVQSGSALHSRPGDVKGLTKNIDRLLSDSGFLCEMRSASRRYYSEVYEYKSVIARLADLLLR